LRRRYDAACLEAARFLNFFVTRLLTEGRDVPEIDETFLYCAFTTMVGAR
jgi:hypothetical protein